MCSQKKNNLLLSPLHIKALYHSSIQEDFKPELRDIKNALKNLTKNPENIIKKSRILGDHLLLDLITYQEENITNEYYISPKDFEEYLKNNPLQKAIDTLLPLSEKQLNSIKKKSAILLEKINNKDFPYGEIDIRHYVWTGEGKQKKEIVNIKKSDNRFPLRNFIYKLIKIIKENYEYRSRSEVENFVLAIVSKVCERSKEPSFSFQNSLEKSDTIRDIVESTIKNHL